MDNNDHQNDITMMITVAARSSVRPLREELQTPHLGTFPNEAEKERERGIPLQSIVPPRTYSDRVVQQDYGRKFQY